MAIGPVGNAIYVNQQMASVASVANSYNNRVDFQNMAAQAAVNAKDEKVLDVRPAEEIHKIDPEREHEKNEADQETAMNKKGRESEEDEEEESTPPLHILDIKV